MQEKDSNIINRETALRQYYLNKYSNQQKNKLAKPYESQIDKFKKSVKKMFLTNSNNIKNQDIDIQKNSNY